jgi:ketosteroid isomerase-like protein
VGANADLLLGAFEAWNRDDLDGWLATLDPGVEIHTSGVFPDLAAEYRGHGEAARFWRQMHEPWEEFRIDVEDVEERGDGVAAAIRFQATGEDSGVHVDMRFGIAVRVRDGLATELVNRRSLEEAREALPAEQPAAEPSRRP